MTAYQTGTATDYKDLLSLLRTFLTTHTDLVNATPSQAWTEMRWDTPDEYELILKGPGLAGTDEIFVGIQTFSDSGTDYYNWRLQGFTSYLAGNAFADQPGAIPIASRPPSLAMIDGSLPYWFVADGRRFVVVTRVSSIYQACYLGFLLPYGMPTQLPYPLAVGGSITGQAGYRYSVTGVSHRHFIDPGHLDSDNNNEADIFSTLRVLHGDWVPIRNWYGSSGEGSQGRFKREVWPYGDSVANNAWAAMRENIDGSTYPLFPAIVYQENPAPNCFGHLDGCFAIPGYGLAAEDIVTISSVDHLVIPNVYRSGAADWWALRLE
jgi:hypothetical protein